jgi:AcrR family transcriptional regulator
MMKELPLRQRKYAATKAALLDAVLARLKDQTLESISVKEVCHEVQLSETTFFNYFASKQAVIFYMVQLWSITIGWEMQQTLAQGGGHLDAICTLFDLTAEQVVQTPGVMGEIVVWQTRKRDAVAFTPLTRAEYALHFADKAGIERLEAQGIDQLLGAQLHAALQSGELAADSDLPALALALMAIFFLTPVFLQQEADANVKDAFRRQLQLVGLPACGSLKELTTH